MHARAIPACASWSRPPAERAAILRFLVTVFVDFDERWLSPTDPGRRSLDELGAQRLILAMTAPPDRRRIAAVAPLLAG
jgi:hypothetical protein